MRPCLARSPLLISAGYGGSVGSSAQWRRQPLALSASRQSNARAEPVAERPAYRQAFSARHCVIPADGFYEWSGPK